MTPINPGAVEWSGENPGIYLRDPARPQLAWGTLALFFRIVISPHGSGRAMLLLGRPDEADGYPAVPNLCVSDNLAMARYLTGEFVGRFAAFRGMPGLSAFSFHDLTGCTTSSDGTSIHQETVRAGGIELTMEWRGLQAPFAADVPPALSATGSHQMYSVFRGAATGRVLLNGTALPGEVVERDFLGGRLSSAFLAFAESWIRPHEEAR